MAKEIGNWSKQRPNARRTRNTTANLFTRRLRPGERVIWSARGSGHAGGRAAPNFSDVSDLFFLILAGFGFAVLLPAVTSYPESLLSPRGIFFVLSFCAAVVIVLRSVFGHALRTYALTQHRLIVIDRLLFNVTLSYAPDQIDIVRVTGSRTRGDIAFRRDPLWLPMLLGAGREIIVGVAEPVRVAELIVQTLGLGFHVRDATR